MRFQNSQGTGNSNHIYIRFRDAAAFCGINNLGSPESIVPSASREPLPPDTIQPYMRRVWQKTDSECRIAKELVAPTGGNTRLLSTPSAAHTGFAETQPFRLSKSKNSDY